MSANARVLLQRGNAQSGAGHWEAALASFTAAVSRDPTLVEAHINRGNVLQALGRYKEALEACDRVLALRPDASMALSNRGIVLKELHRFEESLASFDRAVELEPGNMTARYNRGVLQLLLGQLAQGFEDYEARWQNPYSPVFAARRELTVPRWSGSEPLAGRRILVHAEQGFGDTLQFCRYVPILAAQGAEVVLEVQLPLVPLLADLHGVARIVASGRPLPALDCHCPLMSVPAALGTTLATVPRDIPYLRADLSKVAEWRERLVQIPRPWVGLAWAGSPKHLNDRQRSFALDALIAGLPIDFDYVSVQRDLSKGDRSTLGSVRRLHEWTSELHNFSDTAALTEALDLVISVDTSVAHLSGALGKRCWVLLPFHPDWRWLLDRHDSPWYPTLTLFRQELRGDWGGVLARVADALREGGRSQREAKAPPARRPG